MAAIIVQSVNHASSPVKEFLKKIDRFHILRYCVRFYRRCRGKLRVLFNAGGWYRESTHRNFFSTKTFDRIPYIIRRRESVVGLFSYFITIIGGIAYADKKGYIPVVDMKNCPNTYLFDDELGKINAWEYFFAQPGGISLDDALSCRKYILGPDTASHPRPSQGAKFFYNQDGKLDYWREICKKYIKFSQPVIDGLEREKTKLVGKKVIGVYLRGTDYVALRPHAHPIQPEPEMVIAKTQEFMNTKGYNAVYLTTEDKRILAKFRDAFGESLILTDREYVDFDYDSKEYATMYSTHRTNDKYLQGLEYLVSMLLLRECQGLITSIASGPTGLICLAGEFEDLYVYDLGYYE